MLFNLFKKNKKQNDVIQHLGAFKRSFNEQQKKAILWSLFLIANADKKFDRKEKKFFSETAMMLGYKFSDDYMEFLLIYPEDSIAILKTLTEGQKDWLIVTLLGMVHADGKALQEEYDLMQNFFTIIGVTMHRVESVVKKTQILSRGYL